MLKVLIAEDEPLSLQNLSGQMRDLLGADALIEGVANGREAVERARQIQPQLVLMDIEMPVMNGLDAAAIIHKAMPETHIVFLTAFDRFDYAVGAMRAGGTDYLVKPFAMDLLTAKVQAVLRRVNAVQEKSLEKFGCELNLLTNDLDFQGESVRLTPTEGLIMKLLMLNANQTVSKKKLISALWQGNNFIDENALNVNLSRLRGKLSTLEGPLQITTVRGQGYRLEEKL